MAPRAEINSSPASIFEDNSYLPLVLPCVICLSRPLLSSSDMEIADIKSMQPGERLGIRGRGEDQRSPISCSSRSHNAGPVSYTHLRAHETRHDLVCRLLLE